MATQKRDRTKDVDGRHPAGSRAAAEADDLIAGVRKDIAAVMKFLAAEEKALARQGPSSKRLARLRLISDDLNSARKFSAKSIKG
jgi:hypothetical protein